MSAQRIFATILVLLLASTIARSQFVWQPTMLDHDWRYSYSFWSISCLHGDCTAAAVVGDGVKDVFSNVFLRSTDGGRTWLVQDPGIAAFPWWYGGNVATFRAVQQIDSLNVVAVGDSGMIARTFDGGLTWERQYIPTSALSFGVHFSDPITGIITAFSYDSAGGAYTTHDGGRHWREIALFHGESFLHDCHSYGGEKFRVFSASGGGTVFETFDDWASAGTTHPVVDSATDSTWQSYAFQRCNFGAEDTMIVYGFNSATSHGAIMRTTDAGELWEKPQAVPLYYPTFMTSIDRDTVIAFVSALATNADLVSFDRGVTWRRDSFVAVSGKTMSYPRALAWSSAGPIGIIGEVEGNSVRTFLERGIDPFARVSTPSDELTASDISPNPATSYLRVRGRLPYSTLVIYDILGRPVMSSSVSADGGVTLDTSELAGGAYSVVSEMHGLRSQVGRFVISK